MFYILYKFSPKHLEELYIVAPVRQQVGHNKHCTNAIAN